MSVSSMLRAKAIASRAPAEANPDRTITDALALVASYVPTEVIAVYTLALGLTAGGADQAAVPIDRWYFLAFLLGTPLFVWLVAAVRAREGGEAIPWSPRAWPLWEMSSAVIALLAWSAALPRSMFLHYRWYSASAAVLVMVVVSVILPLVGRLVHAQPPER